MQQLQFKKNDTEDLKLGVSFSGMDLILKKNNFFKISEKKLFNNEEKAIYANKNGILIHAISKNGMIKECKMMFEIKFKKEDRIRLHVLLKYHNCKITKSDKKTTFFIVKDAKKGVFEFLNELKMNGVSFKNWEIKTNDFYFVSSEEILEFSKENSLSNMIKYNEYANKEIVNQFPEFAKEKIKEVFSV